MRRVGNGNTGSHGIVVHLMRIKSPMAVLIKPKNNLEGIVISSTELRREYPRWKANKVMNIIDLRDKFIEAPTGRRLKERRHNPFPYGSKEWRDFILENGFDLPANDRRAKTRRCNNEAPPQEEGDGAPEKPYVRILLTPAERKLLEDVFLSELE